MGLLKLNIGSGAYPIDGYDNLDIKDGRTAFPLAGMADDSVDEIRASHILEHFPHRQTAAVLAEWRRVLKPGGLLKVAVPDFDYVVKAFQNGSREPLEGYIMGGHEDEHDIHGAVFNRRKVEDLMRAVGFCGFREWTSERKDDCASLAVSCNVAGRKVAVESWRPQGVVACISHARFGPIDTAYQASIAFAKLQIALHNGGGVFWNQVLQTMLEDAIEGGYRYVLAVDYDSAFTADDIVLLYDIMERRPDLTALCSVQIGRDRDALLATVLGDDGKPVTELTREMFDRETLPLSTGHFGLTLLRTADLAKLPKPWLTHTPGAGGTWRNNDRTDDDIHFWRLVKRAGLNVALANRVSIGHAQYVISWPDVNLECKHQFVNDWRKDGKPRCVPC